MIPGHDSILYKDLREFTQGIGDQRFDIQVFMMHIHGGDAAVFVGGVVIDALVRVAATGIQSNFRLAVSHHHAATGHGNGGKQMEELADIVFFQNIRFRVTFDESSLHKPGCGRKITGQSRSA